MLADDYLPPSPPSSDPPVLDTADVIAKIKAEAEQEAEVYKEEPFNTSLHPSDSSSESEDSDGGIFGSRKPLIRESVSVRKPKASTSRASSSPNASRRSRRLLNQSPESSPDPENQSLLPRTSRQRNGSSQGPVILTTGLQKKRKAVNPIAKMLKEKEKADTNGYGSFAVLAAGDFSGPENELDGIDLNRLAVATSDADMDVDEKSPSEEIDGGRVEQLLGVEDGQAVGKILNQDRDNRTAPVKPIGLTFFLSHNEPYRGQRSTYIAGLMPGDVKDPVFDMLKDAVDRKGKCLDSPTDYIS